MVCPLGGLSLLSEDRSTYDLRIFSFKICVKKVENKNAT